LRAVRTRAANILSIGLGRTSELGEIANTMPDAFSRKADPFFTFHNLQVKRSSGIRVLG
jgi:hypothetical protein